MSSQSYSSEKSTTDYNDTEQGNVKVRVLRNRERILSITQLIILYISTTPSHSPSSYTIQYYALEFCEKF